MFAYVRVSLGPDMTSNLCLHVCLQWTHIVDSFDSNYQQQDKMTALEISAMDCTAPYSPAKHDGVVLLMGLWGYTVHG